MTKEVVKKAFEEAEKDLKDKQVQEVKKIVLATLEKIDGLKKDKEKAQSEVKDIDKKIKLLKMDIDDLKEGRLDRISERQEKDTEAKATSVVIIIKEREVVREYPYWHWPYQIIWPAPYYPMCPSVWPADINAGIAPQDGHTTSGSYEVYYSSSSDMPIASITCSIAKWATPGTYEVGDDIINLR